MRRLTNRIARLARAQSAALRRNDARAPRFTLKLRDAMAQARFVSEFGQ